MWVQYEEAPDAASFLSLFAQKQESLSVSESSLKSSPNAPVQWHFFLLINYKTFHKNLYASKYHCEEWSDEAISC